MRKQKMNKLENRKHTEVLNLRAGYFKEKPVKVYFW